MPGCSVECCFGVMHCEWYGVCDSAELSAVEVCADYVGVNVFHVCLNSGVLYGSGPQPVGRGPVPVRRPIGTYYIFIIKFYYYKHLPVRGNKKVGDHCSMVLGSVSMSVV